MIGNFINSAIHQNIFNRAVNKNKHNRETFFKKYLFIDWQTYVLLELHCLLSDLLFHSLNPDNSWFSFSSLSSCDTCMECSFFIISLSASSMLSTHCRISALSSFWDSSISLMASIMAGFHPTQISRSSSLGNRMGVNTFGRYAVDPIRSFTCSPQDLSTAAFISVGNLSFSKLVSAVPATSRYCCSLSLSMTSTICQYPWNPSMCTPQLDISSCSVQGLTPCWTVASGRLWNVSEPTKCARNPATVLWCTSL